MGVGVVLLFFAMHLLDSVDRWLLAAVLPQVSDELNLSETQAGWLSTVLLLGLAAASLPVGYLADRLQASSAAGDGFRGLEHGHGRHGPGSIVRPDPGCPCAGGHRQCDLRGCRAHDPDGPVSSSGSRTSTRGFFPGGTAGSGRGIERGGRVCST